MAFNLVSSSTHEGRGRFRYINDSPGTSPWYPVRDYEVTVAAKPASGSVRVEATWSPIDVVLGDNANATSNSIKKAWAPGDASAENADIFRRPTAVRFVASATGAVCEIAS